ncbi:MAG: prolipoprotein diacylglyceryl transferase [Myxococcales bacterium]|nr:prolipoprotein diacylglyceryl transferase [Myxococcales bacterium]
MEAPRGAADGGELMHPVLTELFGYPIHLYAVMMALGFVIGIWLMVRHGERVGYDRDLSLDLCWWILVSGLVGSRIAFIVVNWEQYYYPCVDVDHFNALFPEAAITEPDCTRLLRFWNGGLVFYGGVILTILTIIWFMRREKLPFLPMADVIIPSLALGQFFGRLGCLAAGCCWGRPTDAPWGIEFPARSMVYVQQLKEGIITAGAEHAHSVHPTQLYDSLYGLLLFSFLIWIRRRKRWHGQVFVWWMFLYPMARATVELFRGDDVERGYVVKVVSESVNGLLGLPEGSAAFLSTSQFISLCMIAIAGVLLYRQRKRPAPAA